MSEMGREFWTRAVASLKRASSGNAIPDDPHRGFQSGLRRPAPSGRSAFLRRSTDSGRSPSPVPVRIQAGFEIAFGAI
jgi:hypothetical protein